MTIKEWKKDNKFTLNLRTCGACKYCRYAGDLQIMYCKKMLEETDSHIIDCEIDFEQSWCKVIVEE